MAFRFVRFVLALVVLLCEMKHMAHTYTHLDREDSRRGVQALDASPVQFGLRIRGPNARLRANTEVNSLYNAITFATSTTPLCESGDLLLQGVQIQKGAVRLVNALLWCNDRGVGGEGGHRTKYYDHGAGFSYGELEWSHGLEGCGYDHRGRQAAVPEACASRHTAR